MGIYTYIRSTWKKPKQSLGPIWKERLIKWRSENATTRVDKPIRLDRARSVGYKAKPGILVIRQRVIRGGHTRPAIKGGRRPRNTRTNLALRKNYKQIAEERANRVYKNCSVLNSYELAKDGKYAWYEVILVDPAHPQIKADRDLKWIAAAKHRTRAYHGKTSAGRKSRGLHGKGKGYEKAQPSRRANKRLQ